MYKIHTILRQYDWILIVATCLLTTVGFLAIYSVDLSRGGSLGLIPVQLLALLIGTILGTIVAASHMSFLERNARLIYFGSLALLFGVLLFGTTIRGTTGWFRFAGFSFQPSEFAKIGLICILSVLISKWSYAYSNIRFFIAGLFLLLLPVLLIMMQPDLGSALVLIGIWFGMFVFAGIPWRYTATILISVIVISVLSWMFLLVPYQKQRIYTFLDPSIDPLGSGYNVTQSMIAIGSGGIFGRGLGFGSQSQLHFLPEAQTDFIFAVIAEELGFLGTSVVLILYGIIIWRLLLIAWRSTSEFGVYVSAGIGIFLLVQVVLNIGGATGLLPLTGVTLPFLSYGGTSLIINLILIGVAQSIMRSYGDKKKRLWT
jgi:rod shape determining protein RodA